MIPGALGIAAFAILRLFDTAWSGAVGLVGGVMAAPGLLFVGAPFRDRAIYPLAVLASGLLWVAIGFVASRRATRNPTADWSDYWRHYLVMMGGVWIGAATALVIAAATVGQSLIDL